MVPLLWSLLLCIPTSLLARAHPQSPGSLTPYITNIVPTCAQSCLQSFITDNYPVQVCTAQNFNCLCINPSRSGYSLGEAALTCFYASCEDDGTPPKVVYNICGSIPGAQPNVHTQLLAPSVIGQDAAKGRQNPPVTSRSSTDSITSSSSTSDTTTSRSNRKSSTTKTSASSTESTTSTTSPQSPTPTSIIATEPSRPKSPASSSSAASTHTATAATLTTPQIAGVAVASVGAATLALGLCFFLFCYRRRRKRYNRRPSQGSFVGDKIPDSQDSTPDVAANVPRQHGRMEGFQDERKPPLKVVTPSQNEWQQWPRDSVHSPRSIGLALVPESTHQTRDGPSPITPRSHRTNSQLLPDRPNYSAFPPPPLKLSKRQSRSLHPPIAQYAPDKSPPMAGPRFPNAMDTSQANLQGVKRSLSDPFYNHQHSPVFDGYRGVPYTPWTNPSINVSRPSAASASMEDRRSSRRSSQLPPLQEVLEPPKETHPAFTALSHSHSRKNVPRKKSASSSHYTRFSNESATSFEDLDDETAQSRPTLSPLTELSSPQQRGRTGMPPLPRKSSARLSGGVVDRPRPVPRRTSRPKLGEPLQDVAPRDVTQTAKWKILVSPGLQSLEQSVPSTPRTPNTIVRTPPVPSDDRLPRPWP